MSPWRHHFKVTFRCNRGTNESFLASFVCLFVRETPQDHLRGVDVSTLRSLHVPVGLQDDVPFAVEMVSYPLMKSREEQKFATSLACLRTLGDWAGVVGQRKRTESRPTPKQRCRRSVQWLARNCLITWDYTKISCRVFTCLFSLPSFSG